MRIFLGVTGASGALYGARSLAALTAAGHHVGLCVSDAGARVISHEILGEGPRPASYADVVARFADMFGNPEGAVDVLDADDIACSFASGSSGARAALVAPCSTSTLGRIAHGTGDNLIHRVAEVMLKERGRLVVMPRETPVSLIQLRNMVAITEAGGVVLPAAPGFYAMPQSIDDLVDFVVGKALDVLGIEHALFARWGQPHVATAEDAR
ncbi:MAG: UbiX family flavin prenyltransferase [Thermoleophilia bacterium]|nr:UbiX family flavin prenyltransferase [Thermoleophilia bacterium]